ncbi:MAG: winged helix-turn-helix domain-containing protein [Kangiellaceae bacterium]|jgi:predicted transcriptional regulator|nr:winged helix-turn-helix domain-containing protein [Kangiellaceae bacterium]
MKQSNWTFFSNHGHVYFLLARNSDQTLREVASEVGITERAVIGIVKDLADDGYVTVEKNGRQNAYKIIPNKTLRHSIEQNVSLDDLIGVINKS